MIEIKDDVRILFESELKRSAAYIGDELAGECDYKVDGNVWIIDHTFVSKEYGGRGIAKKLVLKVIEEAGKRNVKIRPVCSYAYKVMAGKEEFADVLENR